MTVDAHTLDGEHYSVTLDGADVSNRCYLADDEAGMVWLYSVDSSGQKFIDPLTGGAARSCLKGRVVIAKL